jgi:protein-disulfide isomerase
VQKEKTMKTGTIFPLSILLLVLLYGGACRAQTATPSGALSDEIVRRIRTEIRSRYSVASEVSISISAPKPSDFPGYDQISVTFTGATRSDSRDFLISKDRKTLAKLEKFDISRDLMSKIDVKGRPIRGTANAKVTIVSFQDFECAFCSKMHATFFPDLLQAYGNKVQVIYKDYPLEEIHPWAVHAAIDANCLAAQNSDAYWDFADYLFAHQHEVAGHSREEAFASLDKAAAERGDLHRLDATKLQACMQKQDETAVRASMAEGEQMGVDGTPTMFVNGERLSGAVPAKELHAIVDRALADLH